jgi:hypothetical protein
MALFACPECRQDVSDQAVACPHCGMPLVLGRGHSPRATSRPERRPTLVVLAAAASVALSGAALIVALRATRHDPVQRSVLQLDQAHPPDAMGDRLALRAASAAKRIEPAEKGIRVAPSSSGSYQVAVRAPAPLDRIPEADDQAATGAALDPGDQELAEERPSPWRTPDGKRDDRARSVPNDLVVVRAAGDTTATPPPPPPSIPSALEVTSQGPRTTFKALGPAGLTIEGKISQMSVADDGATVTITVPLGNLDTGIGLRNEHTKKALDVGTYPTTSLRVRRSALTFPAPGAEASGDATGSLTLHGQTRDVIFRYSARLNGGAYEVRGSTRINVDDYGVKRPSYLGVTVKPDVDVTTAFLLEAVPAR